jgi:hypothetical protein
MNSGTTAGEFGSRETLHRLWTFFRNQAVLLEEVQSLMKGSEDPVALTVLTLLYAATDTNKSIALLAREEKMRDTYVLARTSYETMLNACFILTEGEKAADRAYRHALQKGWRDLHRELPINDTTVYIRHSAQIEPDEDSALRDAIDEFTSKRGREITSWTPASLKTRIEKVGLKYGNRVTKGLQFGLLAIYRHASDISHGTVFGSMYAVGLADASGPPKNPSELQQRQRENLCMLLTLLGGVVDSLLHVLGHYLDVEDFVERSERAVASLGQEPWIQT